jgi:heme oxygenase (biliverdin-IX-beta and delta-forming)
MIKPTEAGVRSLIDEQRVLSLAVVVDGAPYVGLLPFAVLPNRTGVLIHSSTLSKHGRGLSDGARVSVLLHEQYGPGKDPLQVKRLTFECIAHRLERKSEAWEQDRELFMERFPKSRITFKLSDFTLYRLVFQHGLYVAGFGRAVEIKAEDIAQLASDA